MSQKDANEITKDVSVYGLKDIDRTVRSMKSVDEKNAKIVEGLSVYGPRNISLLAKSIGLPNSTVVFRLKKLIDQNEDLEINARLDVSKLGLKKAVVMVETSPGKWGLSWKVLKNLDYLTYLVRCYGRFYGCYAIYAFPAEHAGEFEDYFEKARELEAFSNYLFFWTGQVREVPPNFHWFNFRNREWVFRWQQWIEEVLKAPEQLSKYLKEPKNYRVMADEIDIRMLSELEKDGRIALNKLARMVGITRHNALYRYHKHILAQNLIPYYSVAMLPYPYETSDMCAVVIAFEDKKALAKFANTLNDKPFILSYAKIVGQNSVVVHTYTPKKEFPNFLGALSRLVKENLIARFFHVTLILVPFVDERTPYERLINGTWKYNHEQTLERLENMASK
ncbi:AsnC family transcriptional regulator [Candidatus Bathyarchaeota archaeon]|nr:AsnC family transcriptional regulator [Candidatus Bathyarchaeota archaeon]